VYTVIVANSVLQQEVQLKANGWAEINFDLSTQFVERDLGRDQQGGGGKGKK
jgi:hypothetical protein